MSGNYVHNKQTPAKYIMTLLSETVHRLYNMVTILWKRTVNK